MLFVLKAVHLFNKEKHLVAKIVTCFPSASEAIAYNKVMSNETGKLSVLGKSR